MKKYINVGETVNVKEIYGTQKVGLKDFNWHTFQNGDLVPESLVDLAKVHGANIVEEGTSVKSIVRKPKSLDKSNEIAKLMKKEQELGWSKFRTWAKEKFGVVDSKKSRLFDEIVEVKKRG